MRDTAAVAMPPATADGERPHLLCVDDEPAVLDGLRDVLRHEFEVHVAGGGADALALMRRHPRRYAVVLSDMRMPEMTGAAFLSEARRVAPLATRMLLTGHADVESAMRAVNDGHVFRFLTKPCGPAELLQACAAALWQHRLAATERALLEETLGGCMAALADALRLASPPAFARGQRVTALLERLVEDVGMQDGWEIEAAGMLAELGAVGLPAATARKVYGGEPLTAAEAMAAAGVPALSLQILARIPRLEGVRQILSNHHRRFDSTETEGMLPIGARMLRIALDFDQLASEGRSGEAALKAMAGRHGVYDPGLLETLRRRIGADRASSAARALRSPR